MNAFNGMIYAYSWYLDVVSDDWDALVENDYERVFPLTWRKKGGICYLYQPFFTQQLGIFSRSLLSDEIVERFLKAIPRRFRFVEINLNAHNKVTSQKYHPTSNRNHELDLIDTYDHLQKSYSQNLKRTLRKAEGNKLVIVKDIRPDEVIDVFCKHKGQTVRTLREHDYIRLRKLIYTIMYKGKAQVWGVYSNDNELVAGAVFLFSNRKAVFLFSGTSDRAREIGAMPYLIDQFIREHAQTHLTLDFEGSNNPDLARFYKSFGSKETDYTSIRLNRLPFPISLFITLIKKTKTILTPVR
jgi:hypothetical protein